MDRSARFKALILGKGYTLAAFARVLNVTPQNLNNWIDRGVPGSRVFDVADALEVGAEDIRPFTSDGRKPLTANEAELRRFAAIFRSLPVDEQKKYLLKLRAQLKPE